MLRPYHRCSICHRQYKRQEHLQRHLASHRAQKTCICTACGKTFSRSDALKRHLRTCIAQVSDATQPQSRRRACDRCARLKKACDFQLPCHSCVEKNAHCAITENNQAAIDAPCRQDQFTLPVELFESTPWADMGLDLYNLASSSWNDFLALNDSASQPSLRFLDNFTKNTGLVKSFDCCTPELRQVVLDYAQQHKSTNTVELMQLDKRYSTGPLDARSCEIVKAIKEVTTIKTRNSTVDVTWSDPTQDLCSQFFSPSNLRKCLALYWSIWHPNVNFIHYPTFDATTAKPALLAAMAIIGETTTP